VRIRYFADVRFPLERANGVQTMATCDALARRGHAVHLVVRPDSHTPPRDPWSYYGLARVPGFVIEAVPVPAGPTARRAAYLAHALRLTVGADDADVIFTRDLGLAATILRIPRSCRPPVVYESHGYAPSVSGALPAMLAGAAGPSTAKARRLARREARVWRTADGYVTITAGLCDELAERFGSRERVIVAPDGAHLPAACPPPRNAAGGPPVVGYAGHLYPWKGPDVLLAALQELPGVQGLIVGGLDGEADAARVRALADRLVPGRVTFTGQVEPGRVAACLQDADVLVIPNPPGPVSATYTSPLKLFEYMASGRPVVASDLPSLREVLTDGEHALLAAPGDAAALAAAVRRVLDDRALAARLAARAFEAVQAYSWDRRAERVEGLLKTVCGPESAPATRRLA
jgi:glycosyltransferase involved in cell wall biosynthesis